MRQPLWVINGSLLILLLMSEVVFLLIQTSIPRRVSLTPGSIQPPEHKALVDVDLKKIYGVNDLFGTYVPEVPVLVKDSEFHIPPLPDLPTSIPFSLPAEKAPVFISPLAVTLKGVVYLNDDQEKSIAIIQFNDSKQEQNYRVGELVKDAQILKVYPNRVIVVRSNGQQETLYLREADAKKDLSYDDHKAISEMKVALLDGKYHVPLDTFTAQIHSLGQFIDMLDLTTVYHKGQSVGCRVGKAVKGSIGAKLGLQVDDIVKSVDSIPVTALDSRVKIYDHVIDKKAGGTVLVDVERGGRPVHLTYVLVDTSGAVAKHDDSKKKGTQAVSATAAYDLEQQKKKILEQKVKLAPTAHQIQMDEQKKLLEARRKNMLSNKMNPMKVGKGIV